MPKYQCPECEAVLKRDTPIAEGKKIKCPKCEVIFKAEAMHDPSEDGKKPKAAEKKVAVPADDDDAIGGSYGLVEEKAVTDEEAKRKHVDLGSLRDKYPKSKRGPAMAKTVTPSNLLLLAGALAGIWAILYLGWGLWPFIFSDSPPRGRQATQRVIHIVAAVIQFVVAALTCHGGSKMHGLESYNWSMASCILAILFCVPPIGLAAGIFGIVTLRDEEVLAGYEETATKRPED